MNKKNAHDILKNKTYLYLTEFFAGMAIMAVELGASRLLAPYFSSSQIVWTIIIATIMIAMAAGNVYGGRSADKHPDPDILYRRLLIAAVWIAAIPVLGKYVILLISGALIITVSNHLLVIAAFAACMIIFVFPCFLLGTVTPSLVKYTVDSLAESGTTVGMLGAFNTIGSIIGTFLPTFVTIPAVGTAVTFLIFNNLSIEGVEIDEKITGLAHQYFDLPADAKVTTYDGRAYLAAVDTKYDVILVDAYQDITIPFQMSSSEFFTMVRDHLNEHGVMVVNMNMRTIDQIIEEELAVYKELYHQQGLQGVLDSIL